MKKQSQKISRKSRKRTVGVQFEPVIERLADGTYLARCPALPGCVARGKTQKEAFANIEEVIAHTLSSPTGAALDVVFENPDQTCVHGLLSHGGKLLASTNRDTVHSSPDGTFGSYITMPVTGVSSKFFTPSSGGNLKRETGDDEEGGDYSPQIYCLESYASLGVSKIYAGTNAGGGIYASDDGKRWTLSSNTGEDRVHCLCRYKGSLYAGTSSAGLVFSSQGKKWSQAFDTGEAAVTCMGTWNDKLFAGTYPNGLVLMSEDGRGTRVVLRTEHTFVQSFGTFRDWLYVGAAGPDRITIYRSKDGEEWEALYSSDKDTNIYCFQEFGKTLYVGTGENGRILSSSNGTDFTIAVSTVEEAIRSMAVHEGRLYVGTEGTGKIFRFPFSDPPPARIEDVRVESTSSYGVVLRWTTDIETETTVEYGTGPNLENIYQNKQDTKNHRANLAGLKSATRYGFRPVATSRGGTLAVGAEGNFRTEKVPTPRISSSSHPDPEAWTNKSHLVIDLNAGIRVRGYLYTFDKDPEIFPTAENGTWTTESRIDMKNVADGEYHFRVLCQDDAGNFSNAPAHFGVKIDTHAWPPKVSSPTHPSQSLWVSNNHPRFIWTVENELSGIDGFYCSLDQEPRTIPDSQSGLWSTAREITYPNLDDGTWFFHIISVDQSGNVGTEASHYAIHIDTEAGTPEVVCESHPSPDHYYPSGDIKITWKPTAELSGIAGFYYILDKELATRPDDNSGTWTKATEKFFLNKSEGVWYFHLTAKDKAGNLSRDTVHLKILIDREALPPEISSATHPDPLRYYPGGEVALTLTPPDDLSGIEGFFYTVDTEPQSIPDPDQSQVTRYTVDPQIGLQNIEEGIWYVHVLSRDKAGNVGPRAAHFRIQIDSSVGLVRVHLPASVQPNQWLSQKRVDLEWEARDDVSGIEGYYYILDQESGTQPGPERGTYSEKERLSLEIQEEGVWYFHIVAVDKAGNVGRDPTHSRLRVDLQAPIPDLLSPSHPDQEAWSADPNPRFEWRGEDNLSGTKGFYYHLSQQRQQKFDGTQWNFTEESRAQIPEVKDGQWYFHVATLDHAGNISLPALRKIKIDTKVDAPRLESSTHSSQSGYSSETKAVVRIRPPEDPAGVRGYLYVLDQSAATVPTPASGTFIQDTQLMLGDLREGDWVLHVSCVDGVGNVSQDAAHLMLRVDLTAPTAQLGDLPLFAGQDEIQISWEGSDALSGIASFDLEVKRGSEDSYRPWLSKTDLRTATFKAEDKRSYQFRVRATDRAGNIGAFQESLAVTVDASPPDPVVDLRSESRSRGDVALFWTAIENTLSGLAHYNIYRSMVPESLGERIVEPGRVNEPGWVDKGKELTDGTVYYYTVLPVDRMGHEQTKGNSQVPGLCSKSVDAPVISSETHPSSERWFSNAKPSFSWLPPSSAMGVTGYYYALDNEDRALGTGYGIWTQKPEAHFSKQAEGMHVFRVVARDRAGNMSGQEARMVIRIDTQPPSVARVKSSSHPDSALWYPSGDVEMNLDSADEGSGLAGFYFLVDRIPESKPQQHEGQFVDPGLLHLPTIPEGENWVHIVSVDHAGNMSEPLHHRVRISTSPPPPNNIVSSTHPDPSKPTAVGFPNFSWDRPQWGEKPVPGFFWSVDDRPDSVPTDQDGFIQETNLTAGHRVDGIWFLHVVGATEDKIPGQRAMHFRFQILSEAKVAGIVLQKDGKTPVVGLGLRVEGAPGSWITKTDTHGKFDFGSLPVADLRLSTKMEDRPPLTLELPAGHSEIANLMLNDELVIFPAVVRDGSFSLYYHMPRKGLVILEVYDPHGHVVIHREVERPGGNFLRLQCDASKYPEGDYTLKIMARFEDGNTPRISLRKFTIKK